MSAPAADAAPYAVTTFQAVSLLSFRMLHVNAFSARTLPCPTPATVKLALLAKLLERDGADPAPEHLRWLAPLEVWWHPPPAIAISAANVRIYKADAADKPLTPSKGLREYAHFSGPFSLALGPVPDEWAADLAFALGQLRALGTAESLVQPLAPPAWANEPPAGAISLTTDGGDADRGFAVVLDDLGSAPAWERLDVYRAPGRRAIPQIGPDRVRRIVTLPLEVVQWSQSSYVLAQTEP